MSGPAAFGFGDAGFASPAFDLAPLDVSSPSGAAAADVLADPFGLGEAAPASS